MSEEKEVLLCIRNQHMASFSGNKEFFDLVNKIEDLKVKITIKKKSIVDIKDKFEKIDIEENKPTGINLKNSSVGEPSKIHVDELKDS